MRVTARFMVFPQNEPSENSSKTFFLGVGGLEWELSSEMLCDSAKQAEKKTKRKTDYGVAVSLKILHPRPCL